MTRSCVVAWQPSGGGAKAEAKKATGVPLLKIHWDAISPDKVTASDCYHLYSHAGLEANKTSFARPVKEVVGLPVMCTSNTAAGSMQAPD